MGEVPPSYIPPPSTTFHATGRTEISVFTFHKSDEGVSVNTVAVVPGATEALSGGDDQQVTWMSSHQEFMEICQRSWGI